MKPNVSIAIETSCRAGGVALGRGDSLAATIAFDASRRHATQLISHLDGLLRGASMRPGDVDEAYVSAGPGSFTGLRVGLTVTRTLGQAVPHLRCVAVPTALAVAENARDADWKHLAVIMDAREGSICAGLFERRGGRIVQAAGPRVLTPQEFLAAAPRPLMLIGEGLAYSDLTDEKVQIGDSSLHLPTAEGVWRVGRRMAQAGQFTDCKRLLPIYVRQPKVLRQWQAGQTGQDRA